MKNIAMKSKCEKKYHAQKEKDFYCVRPYTKQKVYVRTYVLYHRYSLTGHFSEFERQSKVCSRSSSGTRV